MTVRSDSAENDRMGRLSGLQTPNKFYKILVFFARACYNNNMLTQKIAGICLSALVLAGICAGAAAPLSARADGEPLPEEPEQTVLSTENAELFLPDTYEQYLPLKSPSYMAMNDSYIAVADGQTLYLFDKGEARYFAYEAPIKEEDKITKVQFSEGGRLFFSAGGLFFETPDEDVGSKPAASAKKSAPERAWP